MSDYQRIDNGERTAADDPERGIWYATGKCGYWTDDWSKLTSSNGIPTCPGCGAPGFQTTAGEWFDGAKEFAKTNAHYNEFLSQSKEHCVGKAGPGFLERYKDFASSSSEQ